MNISISMCLPRVPASSRSSTLSPFTSSDHSPWDFAITDYHLFAILIALMLHHSSFFGRRSLFMSIGIVFILSNELLVHCLSGVLAPFEPYRGVTKTFIHFFGIAHLVVHPLIFCYMLHRGPPHDDAPPSQIVVALEHLADHLPNLAQLSAWWSSMSSSISCLVHMVLCSGVDPVVVQLRTELNNAQEEINALLDRTEYDDARIDGLLCQIHGARTEVSELLKELQETQALLRSASATFQEQDLFAEASARKIQELRGELEALRLRALS